MGVLCPPSLTNLTTPQPDCLAVRLLRGSQRSMPALHSAPMQVRASQVLAVRFGKFRRAVSVDFASPMPFATDSAICGRLSVVDAMFDWLERPQIGEDALQIIIRKVAEVPPRHGRCEFAGADMTGAHDLREQRFVVIGDAPSFFASSQPFMTGDT